MNWVVLLARNNLQLTKKAVQTIRNQDIPIQLLVIDNASTDGTAQWLQTQDTIAAIILRDRISVAEAWNKALGFVFDQRKEEYVLMVNNDVELRPDTYRHLIQDGGGFVTAVGVRDPEKIQPTLTISNTVERTPIAVIIADNVDIGYPTPDPKAKRPHPDFSCYLIRRQVWEKVGKFDEGFEGAFCEDWDYHCRMHQAGITAECLDLPFLHHGSMTVKNADPKERQRITVQAEKNREYFKKKWGFAGGSPEYYRFFNSGSPPTDPSLEKAPVPSVPALPVEAHLDPGSDPCGCGET